MVFTKKLCYTDSKRTFEPINKEDIPMQLTVRQPSASEDAKHYTTERLRGEYLIETVFAPDDAILTYSHFDRIIAGGVMPVSKSVELVGCKELASDTFLQRREMGVINIGGKGKIAVDGVEYDLKQYDGLYVGMGAKTLSFTSDDPADPAKFYINTCPRTRPIRPSRSTSTRPTSARWAAWRPATSASSTSTSIRRSCRAASCAWA